jgi:hypothetical protein
MFNEDDQNKLLIDVLKTYKYGSETGTHKSDRIQIVYNPNLEPNVLTGVGTHRKDSQQVIREMLREAILNDLTKRLADAIDPLHGKQVKLVFSSIDLRQEDPLAFNPNQIAVYWHITAAER